MVIEIGIDPTIELGPVTLAWHGITIALGIVIGGVATARYARGSGLDTERLSAVGLLLVVFGLVGGRLLYLIESGNIADPGEWLGTRGFSLNGGVVLVAGAIGMYILVERLSLRPRRNRHRLCARSGHRARRRLHQRRALRSAVELLARRAQHPSGGRHARPGGRLSLGRPLRGSARRGDLRPPLAPSPPLSPPDDAALCGGGPVRRGAVRRGLLPPRQRRACAGAVQSPVDKPRSSPCRRPRCALGATALQA